ncbi:MAG TPA: hypothetical protein ENN68_01260 [Methanomicrobia archaeon]|nr:hypothetical protein [Methanomicrobia archaeon]
MSEKIQIQQYHDWWFDNAVEFLGYLLEKQSIAVEWDGGISFTPLNYEKVDELVERIERLVDSKLRYQTSEKATGRIVEKNRAYLPTMHRGRYVSFLALKISERQKKHEKKEKKAFDVKKEIIKYLYELFITQMEGSKTCDICGNSLNTLFQVSQTTYPVVTGSLKSQCGVRKMESEYHCCVLCAFLGAVEWLDDIPFACDYANFTHYLLFPKIENIKELHIFKNKLRRALTQHPYSNVVSVFDNVHGEKREVYTKDEYSLLLALFEQMWEKIGEIDEHESLFCESWMRLKIKGMEATYQTKSTYLEEIHIPHIERLKTIFEELLPYSDFVSHSFAFPLKEGVSREIIQRLIREDQYLLSRGIIMDDFKTFSKAFQMRQNCRLSTSKEGLDYLIYKWRCKDGAV